MIRNSNYFEQIEDYILDQMNPEIKLEFENELALNPELRDELQLWMNIQKAFEENEILTLREKLKNISVQSFADVDGKDTFELLDDLNEITELTDNLSPEDLINYFESLPKVHVYQHNKSSNENIHQFYKEQSKVKNNIDDDLKTDLDEFEGLEEAILEKDILLLRQTLNQVSKSIEPQYSVEAIDEYLNGDLQGSEFVEFQNDLIQNRNLRAEVNLYKEIDEALFENDIIDLRNQLRSIVKSETSWNVSEVNIEEFLDGMLEGELLDNFESELNDNLDLQAEIELRKQINSAIGEIDIIGLRASLKDAKENAESQKVKMLIPETKSDHYRFWKTSVAVIVILLGIGGIFHGIFNSVNGTYNHYYNAPVWSPERSVSNEISIIQKANINYSERNFNQVIYLLDKVEAEKDKPVYDFYKGASYQNLGEFKEAINEFSKVIDNGDNLFIEEAQWYRSLCYLKAGDKSKAKSELLAVIERKGHYEKDAKAVLRRLRIQLK